MSKVCPDFYCKAFTILRKMLFVYKVCLMQKIRNVFYLYNLLEIKFSRNRQRLPSDAIMVCNVYFKNT